MQFYSKEALQLVYDQVNRDNPELPVPLTPANTALTSGPTARNANGRNTEVKFTAYPGSGLRGTVTLNYDRITVQQLWPSTQRPIIYLSSDVKTISAALPFINDVLGINLRLDDVSNPTAALLPGASLQDAQVNIAAASPAYSGAIYFSYQTKQIGYYPNSGPGSKYLLAGNTIMGYFGKVSTAEFYTRTDFWNVTLKGSAASYYTGGTEGWYKFFYQGSVVYIPVSPVASNLSWNIVYASGVAYGTDDNGLYPGIPVVNQSKILTLDKPEGRFYLRPRLPTAHVNDPDNSGTGNPTPAQIAGSILELMGKVRNGEWDKNTSTEWGANSIMLNTITGNTTYNRLATMAGTLIQQTAKTSVGAAYYYWPVVELVDPGKTTLVLENFNGKYDYTFTPTPARPENQLQIVPIKFGLPGTEDFTPVASRTENQMALAPIALGQPKTVDYGPVAAKAEPYTPPAKTNLSSANGELNGFK